MEPGLHTPLHAPLMHAWLVHDTGELHTDWLHDWTPLPEHWVMPSVHGPEHWPPVQALLEQGATVVDH